MNQSLLLTRRAAIRMASIFGVLLSSNAVFEFFGGRPWAELVKKITGFYSFKEDAAILGIEYLNSAPEEADMYKIVDLICPSDSAKYRQLAHANSHETHAIIVGWQREDFEQGRIVNVSGWLLSETEARVCALTALTGSFPKKGCGPPGALLLHHPVQVHGGIRGLSDTPSSAPVVQGVVQGLCSHS